MHGTLAILTLCLRLLRSRCVARGEADDKAVAEFYAKRTVTIAVGFSAGGNYDSTRGWCRANRPAHSRQPHVIVQNMPGAGSRRLANTLANVGPHDGTMIGLPNQGIAMDQALGTEGVKFDARKFNWIGSPVEDNNVFWGWHTNPVKTIERRGGSEFIVRRDRTGLAHDVLYADHERPARYEIQGRRRLSRFERARHRHRDGRGRRPGGELDRAEGHRRLGRDGQGRSSCCSSGCASRRSAERPHAAGSGEERQASRDVEFLCLVSAMGRPFSLPRGRAGGAGGGYPDGLRGDDEGFRRSSKRRGGPGSTSCR